MSTSSTNKEPLLMDRPWANGVRLTAKYCPDLLTITSGMMEVLLDGLRAGFDGALIDTVQVVTHDATSHDVALFLSFAGTGSLFGPDNVMPIAKGSFSGVGVIHTMELPELIVPVPAVAMAAPGSQAAGKNRGIWVPRGAQILVARLASAASLTGVQVVGLGGEY